MADGRKRSGVNRKKKAPRSGVRECRRGAVVRGREIFSEHEHRITRSGTRRAVCDNINV